MLGALPVQFLCLPEQSFLYHHNTWVLSLSHSYNLRGTPFRKGPPVYIAGYIVTVNPEEEILV